MPLSSHHVDFSGALLPLPHPVGMFSLIGEDGNHYVIVSNPDASGVGVCCAETDSVITTINQTQWRTDGAALTYASVATLNRGSAIPIPGTSKFYMVGYKFDVGGTGFHAVLLVRYRIVNSSTVSVDGTRGYVTSGHSQVPSTGYCYGARVIQGSLYAAMDTGTFSPSAQTSYLWQLPITGSSEDLTNGSFDALATNINTAYPFGTALGFALSPRQYYNRIALVRDPGGIGMYLYWGQDEVDTNPSFSASVKMFYAVAEPSAHTCTAKSDVSADFGIPFSDTMKTFAGTASSVTTDDYTSPSVTESNELLFVRSFTDNLQFFRYQRFSHDPSTATVTFVNTAVAQGSAISMSTGVNFAQLYRPDDISLESMMRDNNRLIFLSFSLAPPSGFGGYIPKVRHI